MIAARPRKIIQGLMAAGVLAVAVFLSLYFPGRDDTTGAQVGAAFAFGAGAIGFAAVGRARPLPRRTLREHARLMALSLMIGIALGTANLLANYGIASLDSRIHAQMSEQFAQFSAWSMVFADPLLEEIGVRLLLMGGIAWLLTRFTDDSRTAFFTALTVSALAFALLHVVPGSRPATGALHATAVVLKTGAAGLLLGWVFWRWGLPYSFACHGTANAIHFIAMPAFF
jgi:membrane protease YdiL (CAAX protease family)